MKWTYQILGTICLLPASHIYAAAVEQSGQSILPFLEEGNYFEVGLYALDSSMVQALHRTCFKRHSGISISIFSMIC